MNRRKIVQKKRSKRSKRRLSKPTCSKQKGGSGYTFNLSVCNPPGGLMEVVRYETCKDTGHTGGKRRKTRRRNIKRKQRKKNIKRSNRKQRKSRRKQRGGNNCSNCNVVNRNLGCKQPEWTPDCI